MTATFTGILTLIIKITSLYCKNIFYKVLQQAENRIKFSESQRVLTSNLAIAGEGLYDPTPVID